MILSLGAGRRYSASHNYAQAKSNRNKKHVLPFRWKKGA